MKLCRKCNAKKDDNDFYFKTKGILGVCKDCHKKDVSLNRKAKEEYYKQYDRDRANLPHRVKARKEYQKNNPDVFRKAKKKYLETHPEKYKAVNKVNNYKRFHDIQQPCLICGEEKSQAHHEDYNKPLEIIWLCDKHHKELHKNRKL